MKAFALKFVLLSLIITGIVFWINSSNVWYSLDLNEKYTYARWNSLYNITEQHDIDLLMMGNSRIYNGINPELLASKTSTTPFILGAPGASIKDQYFSLKEILKRTKVRMLIVETSCISKTKHSAESVSRQLKSFDAKKDIASKLGSTPFLFALNHWPYAWFKSIRNHNYLFDDQQDFEKNKESHQDFLENIHPGEDGKYMGVYQLYLGRFNKANGLTKKTLERYKSEGAPADGRQMTIGPDSKYYLKKLDELCKREDIELVFITIPVYYQHIKRYEVRQAAIADLIEPLGRKWCDLQAPFDKIAFSPDCFENIYEPNQHTTKQGSLVATQKFAQFLQQHFADILPNRSQEPLWNELFYGQEYYFYKHPVKPNDPKNRTLGPVLSEDGVRIEKLCLQEQTSPPTIFAMVKRTAETEQKLKTKALRLTLGLRNQHGKVTAGYSHLEYCGPCSSERHLVFTKTLKKLDIVDLYGMQFVEAKHSGRGKAR